jgi:hypothetical protein
MPGPAPKDPSVRARRNKKSTRATLISDEVVTIAELPEFDWHPQVGAWWDDLWSSPMAPEYMNMDKHALFRVARLIHQFWVAEGWREMCEIQIRLEKADADFGTVPLARMRLQWEREKSEEAKDKGKSRRERQGNIQPKAGEDPRSILRAVN